MRPPRIIAVDVGAGHVAGGVFTADAAGQPALREFASETLPSDPSLEPHWVGHVAQALAAVAARLKCRAPVMLAVPGHLVLTKFVKTPAVAPATRGKIIRFEASQNIPYPLGEVGWTHEVVADDGLDLEIMLAAVKREAMEELCAAADSAGFRIARARPAGLALCQAFRVNYPGTAGTVLVADIGARSTQLIVIEAGRFFARTLALGGNAITAAVAGELQLDFARAELVKISVLAGHPDRPADGPARAAVQRAVENFTGRLQIEITRSLVSYGRPSVRVPPSSVYLTGGGSLIPKLPAVLAEKFQLPVGRYDPRRNVTLSARALAGGADASMHRLALLVGLAAPAAAGTEADNGLLPPAIREVQAFRRRQPFFLGAAALLALALLPPIWHYHRQAAADTRHAEGIQAQLQPMQAMARRNADNLARIGEAQKQIAAIQGLVAAKSNWINFLTDLQDRLARIEDVWLDQLSVVRSSAPDPAAAAGGPAPSAPVLHLRLSGRLLDVHNPVSKVSPDSYARVQQLLASFTGSPFIAAIENERFDNSQPGLLHFDFTLVVNPQHPL